MPTISIAFRIPSYTFLKTGLARAGDAVGRIEDVDRRIRNRRSLVIAQADLGDREGCAASLRALEKDVAAAAASRPPRHPVEFTNSLAATELIRAQVAAGCVEDAFRTADAFSEGYRGRLLGEIAAAAATPNQHMYQPRRKFDARERLARLEIVRRVEQAAGGIAFADRRPDAELAIAFAELGEFAEAIRVARRFGTGAIASRPSIDLTATPYILFMIGRAQAQAGRKGEARSTLREAFALIERDADLIRTRGGQVASGQIEADDADGALRTIELMHNEERPRLLADLAALRARSGDAAGARSTFARALREAEEQAGPRRVAADVASIQGASGDLAAAAATLRKITDPAEGAAAARETATALVRVGDPDGALRWALSLEAPLRSDALIGLAEAVNRP